MRLCQGEVLLAVDIGNSNVAFGVFRSGRLVARYTAPTRASHRAFVKRIVSRHGITGAAIASVVPACTRQLAGYLHRLTGNRPVVFGDSMAVPIKNLYRIPCQVGQDRLVNALAAVRLYGAPSIVVDFGTAVTFDVVSGRGEYLGGLILPGLCLCLDVLTQRTALLPRVELAAPRELIGRDTKSSMRSGVIYGAASAVDCISSAIKKEIGSQAKVIATGGDAGLVKRFSRCIGIVDKDLTLKGIELSYRLSPSFRSRE